MDTLRSHLSRVRIPDPSTRIYKQECCVSFSTPRSEGGLFVDMHSFLAFGKEYVMWNYEKTGNPVYLNIQETPKQVSEDRPHKKPTLLAIGIEGGFDSKEPEYEVSYSIVMLPEFISLTYPSVELPEKVRLAADAILAAVGAERKEQVAAWTADKKKVSPFARSLEQLDNGVKVPPTGWKCFKCDKTENLWMNLTDGTILCGRRNWDGTGGNNHALEHYQQTKYPLAVKLGTITADLEGADVYSYAEDDTVEDPFLADHLAHFGIDFSSLRKTEMTTAERELDQNTNFDWNRIQEKGKELEPLFGPGFTGLTNLGNSCYLASVMQAVFATKDFQRNYYENVKLDDAFMQAPADPTLDLHMQLSKLAHGILSGKYAVPSNKGLEIQAAEEPKGKSALTSMLQGQDGIPPRMFKSLIGTGHSEFASSRQQDALEFFQHFLEQVEQNHAAAAAGEDPSQCFKFVVEERIMCSVTKKVKYTRKTDNILSLNIPLRAAVNKDEVAAYEKRVAERELAGEKSDEEIVRPRVPLAACLESFHAPEEVQDFYSSAINARTTAIKTTRLATFPDYLVLHMRKFVLAAGWVPKKLDVFVDVPDEIDISDMRSSGMQPDEQLLPETPDEIPEQAGPVADEAIVSQLLDIGFPKIRCEKAAIETLNTGVDKLCRSVGLHSKSVPLIMDSSAGIALSSGDQDVVLTVEDAKAEKRASEMDQELLEEGELEDGELSGGWENGEEEDDDDDDAADNADPLNFRDDEREEGEAEKDYKEEVIVDFRTESLTPVGIRFGLDGRINQAAIGGPSNQLGKDHLKNSKRRKGKGALSRQRKRSRLEKAHKGSNEPIVDVSVDGRRQGGHVTLTTRVEPSGAGRNAGGKQHQSGCTTVAVDAGPEEGEVVEELVEEEVGLWTTDVGDEQITSSKVDSDEDGKKKVRAPISAERKLKKKVAFRRKRAEKEKELGIRRPRLPVSTFKPKVPLCKFFIKGRCTLGAKCTFSHDVVPITKSDPCKFFMVNRCLKGDDCPFSHSLDTFPCKFWHTRGHCLDGNNCRFSHGPLTDDQRQNLAKRIEHDSKEQLNVLDISTGVNNAPEDSESEYMPTVNIGQNEALGWDVNPPQALNQDTSCHELTSMTSHTVPYNRQAPSAALRTSVGGNQSSVVLGEVNREEIQLTDVHKEDTPAENAVLLAARKAASAAAVQAAGTTDKSLLSRSGSVTGISLPKSRSFGRFLPSRGPEASAMDLLRASISNDGGRDLSGNANSSQAVSNTGALSALVSCRAGAVKDMGFPSNSPLSRAAPSSLARGSSFGHTRQAVAPISRGSAMELLQASLGNEATPDENTREVDLSGL